MYAALLGSLDFFLSKEGMVCLSLCASCILILFCNETNFFPVADNNFEFLHVSNLRVSMWLSRSPGPDSVRCF